MPESAAQEFARLQRLTPQDAVDYLQRRDRLTQTFSWQDLWHDEHAQQFTVSRLARLDLLKAMQDGITKSVQGDLTRRDWMRDTHGLLKDAGWWGEKEVLDPVSGDVVTTKFDSARLKLIFDTNTRMANSAGLWERVWRNRSTHPYVRYITRGDDRVREAHRAWANLTLPVDHPFWERHWPPNGWRCRCRTMSMTQAEYDRRDSAGEITTEAPPEEFITWTNKRTGEVSEVPAGVTPGFDYNPGLARARLQMLEKTGLGKLDDLPAPIRKAAMTPVIRDGVGEAFAQAVSDAHAALPMNARRALAANGYEVRVVSRLIDEAPELSSRRPAGFPQELDYRHVDGLAYSDKKLILIAEAALDSDSGKWMTAPSDRGVAVLRHEVGHVLDYLNDLAAEPTVKTAWEQESAALLPYKGRYTGEFGAGTDSEISYFAEGHPRGTREVIAELFAIRHGSRTASFIDADTAFAATMAALYKILEEKGM